MRVSKCKDTLVLAAVKLAAVKAWRRARRAPRVFASPAKRRRCRLQRRARLQGVLDGYDHGSLRRACPLPGRFSRVRLGGVFTDSMTGAIWLRGATRFRCASGAALPGGRCVGAALIPKRAMSLIESMTVGAESPVECSCFVHVSCWRGTIELAPITLQAHRAGRCEPRPHSVLRWPRSLRIRGRVRRRK